MNGAKMSEVLEESAEMNTRVLIAAAIRSQSGSEPADVQG
jgi:hypothetical protein